MPTSLTAFNFGDTYPPMSHPSADPARHANVARAAGLRAPEVESARILEIGCATGHHLLSLASRWPHAQCTGLDQSAKAIAKARHLAQAAGLTQTIFVKGSLFEFEADTSYDFIIAHGFFSWVPDDVKTHLMSFIGKFLAPTGLAVVSFNVSAGWQARERVIQKVRAIQAAGNVDVLAGLHLFQQVADASERVIINDMLAKGPEILAFDDFAPVMDPWPLSQFKHLAERSGLRLLGDGLTGKIGSDEEDLCEQRTFRSELLCRADAPLDATSPLPQDLDVRYDAPAAPKLNPWRMTCVRMGLPVVDATLKPCRFTPLQLQVMQGMDGSRSVSELAQTAQRITPPLDFPAFFQHLVARGLFS